MRIKKIESLWEEILSEIGHDVGDPDLRETPARVARMYREVFRGYVPEERPKLTVSESGRASGLIIDKGYYFSMCVHHAVPFFGPFYFGYIPNKLLIGASKIGRLIDYHAARLQMAEKLAYDVVSDFERTIKPLGCILILSGRHLCKEMRGVKKWDSPFEVIEARGVLLSNKTGSKDEFMARIGARI